MKHIKNFQSFVDEGLISEMTFSQYKEKYLKSSEFLLDNIFKEAKKSNNFSKVEMTNRNNDDANFIGDYIYIKSKLKGKNSQHKNDYDEFSIGIDKDTNKVILIYEPNGYDEEISSIQQFKEMTRA